MAAKDHWEVSDDDLDWYESEVAALEAEIAEVRSRCQNKAQRLLAQLRLRAKVPTGTPVQFDGTAFVKKNKG